MVLPPTAQASLAERAATAERYQTSGGLGTTDHWVPSQCSMRLLLCPPGLWSPTAHISSGDKAETVYKLLLSEWTSLGLGTTSQAGGHGVVVSVAVGVAVRVAVGVAVRVALAVAVAVAL